MSIKGELIAVFESTHETMRAERAFKERRIKVRAIMKPRVISSSCQMALSLPDEKHASAVAVISDEALRFVGFFRKSKDGQWTPEL